MNIFSSLEEHKKKNIINTLLPYGCDLTTAKYILYALHYDLGFINVTLLEDITETGLYRCLDRLSFNIYDLNEYEREVLIGYCLTVIHESTSVL